MVGATEGERLFPHLPIPIQWAQRPLTFFPFHCPTLYIIIYLQLITPTVQNTTGSYTYSGTGCYNCNTLYGVQLALRFMQLRELAGFHSGINNLIFLLLHEATLLGKWLQTFRQTVRVSLSKGQMFVDYSVRWRYNLDSSSKSAGKHYPMTRGPKHIIGCMEDEMG